jgi:hypothetical protein
VQSRKLRGWPYQSKNTPYLRATIADSSVRRAIYKSPLIPYYKIGQRAVIIRKQGTCSISPHFRKERQDARIASMDTFGKI